MTTKQSDARARIRAAEDALAEIEAQYGVKLVAIVETWPNGQQFPTYRFADTQKANVNGNESNPTRNRSD